MVLSHLQSHSYCKSFKCDFSYSSAAVVKISADNASRGPSAVAELPVFCRHACDFRCGFPLPPNYNPADHFVRTLAVESGIEDKCQENIKVSDSVAPDQKRYYDSVGHLLQKPVNDHFARCKSACLSVRSHI